jgi:hypothetical protein
MRRLLLISLLVPLTGLVITGGSTAAPDRGLSTSQGPATKCAVTDIWTVNVDGSGEQRLFERALQPVWSPDGGRLLFRKFLGPAEADMEGPQDRVARRLDRIYASPDERRLGHPGGGRQAATHLAGRQLPNLVAGREEARAPHNTLRPMDERDLPAIEPRAVLLTTWRRSVKRGQREQVLPSPSATRLGPIHAWAKSSSNETTTVAVQSDIGFWKTAEARGAPRGPSGSWRHGRCQRCDLAACSFMRIQRTSRLSALQRGQA